MYCLLNFSPSDLQTAISIGDGSGTNHFFFQAEDGIRFLTVTGVQTCALPILKRSLFSVSAFSWGALMRSLSIGSSPVFSSNSRSCMNRGPSQIGRASCRERVEMSGVEHCVDGDTHV